MLRQARQVVTTILHAEDPPERIAWGVAIGIFIASTPTMGIQMLMAGLVAGLLRGNRMAAVAAVWVSNPWTMIPFYWLTYLVGASLIGGHAVDYTWFKSILVPNAQHGWWAHLQYVYSEFAAIFVQLWLGGVLVGILFGAISYYASLLAVRRYHRLRELARQKAHADEARAEAVEEAA